MSKRFCLPILICVAINIISCQPDSKKSSAKSTPNTQASEETVNLKVSRFEFDLFSIPVDSVEKRVPYLKKTYGPFLDIFTNKIINIGSSDKPQFPKYLKSFITDRYMYLTYQKVKEVYPNFDEQTTAIENAFTKYHEIFPKKAIPHVYTMISGYNQSIVTADTILGISVDKYLGKDCEYYVNLGLPNYQRKVMTKEYLATDALRGWSYSEFLFNDSAENILTNILYEGKIVYLMKELFPEASDTIIFGYSENQLNWCKKNINQMWTYLIENKLVVSTDYMTINKLINPAPFTALFSNESPG
ncbi:MAG TPA: hypothetical protein VHO90_07105, partial [Bacteroidales bacterium]|nr:hypothetical protein [Bacteroidales bacterium]